MSKSVGKSAVRVDAYDKATGRAKYMDDLCDSSALIIKICHEMCIRDRVWSWATCKIRSRRAIAVCMMEKPPM